MPTHGIVASGHGCTAEAARTVLREGGNAFDAAIAAHLTACVAEPVLSSLGGGGFLLAQPTDGEARVYDFFAHTPRRPPGESRNLDFHPIVADFGTVTQEFHIGMASVATPGTVAGLYALQADLGRMPMRELLAPAIDCARRGVSINAFQAYVLEVVGPIYAATDSARRLFGSRLHADGLLREGEQLFMPELADVLEALSYEGEELFYQGELGQRLALASEQSGGLLRRDDLQNYRVQRRRPLTFQQRGATLLTNPPPSTGGLLIAFGLGLLDSDELARDGWGGANHLLGLARAMQLTQSVREQELLRDADDEAAARLLAEPSLAEFRGQLAGLRGSRRGTTQISIMDEAGNVASLTVSNGEGCGHVVPGTGFMLNNMLGEEDLNPRGFHQWPADSRLSSMMSPSILRQANGDLVATGSGGSNRIRTAVLQVLVNLSHFGLPLEEAVNRSRIHFEGDKLDIEAGLPADPVERLCASYPRHHVWADHNLFFGGAHSVARAADSGRLHGIGDRRRAGVCIST